MQGLPLLHANSLLARVLARCICRYLVLQIMGPACQFLRLGGEGASLPTSTCWSDLPPLMGSMLWLNLASMSALSLSKAYQARELSPVEVLSSCLERIERFEPKVNAFVVLDREGALRAAQASEFRWRRGEQLWSRRWRACDDRRQHCLAWASQSARLAPDDRCTGRFRCAGGRPIERKKRAASSSGKPRCQSLDGRVWAIAR